MPEGSGGRHARLLALEELAVRYRPLDLTIEPPPIDWLLEGLVALYVDEENPQDVVGHRLEKLGLTTFGNLRFLSNEGIRLDRRPEDFLEEAVDYNPELIVLDSLTRIHTEDENNSGAMSKLYNDGIKPLTRHKAASG